MSFIRGTGWAAYGSENELIVRKSDDSVEARSVGHVLSGIAVASWKKARKKETSTHLTQPLDSLEPFSYVCGSYAVRKLYSVYCVHVYIAS